MDGPYMGHPSGFHSLTWGVGVLNKSPLAYMRQHTGCFGVPFLLLMIEILHDVLYQNRPVKVVQYNFADCRLVAIILRVLILWFRLQCRSLCTFAAFGEQ